jgi:hypothetical protein
MSKNPRPLLETGLEEEKVLEYDVAEFPWSELVSEILQVAVIIQMRFLRTL